MDSISRLFDIPYHQLENYPIEDALVTKKNGLWQKTSSRQYVDSINAVSRALLRIGVQPSDKIGIVNSNNRTEWHILDMAITQLGASNVPIYPTISKEDFLHILNHSQMKYCFVSDKTLYERILLIKNQVESLVEVFSFDPVEGIRSWQDILTLGEDQTNQSEVESRKNSVKTEDLATIIYTSGTTGKPKGVMLSHKNIIANIMGCESVMPIETGALCLSCLPVCHVFERMLTTLYQYHGMRLYFAESMDKLGDNFKELKPMFVIVVPRLVEKLYGKISSKGNELPFIKRQIFNWAVELGKKYEPYGQNGWWYEKKLSIARGLVLNKWKEAVGGRLMMICGGAAIDGKLVRLFSACEIPIWEGYGLTETSPVISTNCAKGRRWKIGSVGKPIDNVEVKIAEDGEILCKAESVMMGYYKEEELTKEVIDKDGYFHTGDIGFLDKDNFLTITDRKKEIFKTSGGKYIAPQQIEGRLVISKFFDQAMVVGEGKKMPGAIIQPNFQFIRSWAKKRKIKLAKTNKEILENKEVIKRLRSEVDRINEDLGKWEKIKVYAFVSDEWGIDSGELTPTLKIKRRVILEKYKDLYQRLYKEENTDKKK